MAKCIQCGMDIEKGVLCQDCLDHAVTLYKLAAQDWHKRKTCLFCGAEIGKNHRKYTCMDPVCITMQEEAQKTLWRKNARERQKRERMWRKEERELKKAAKKEADNITERRKRLAECERNAKAMGLSYGMYMAVRMKRLSPEHIRV